MCHTGFLSKLCIPVHTWEKLVKSTQVCTSFLLFFKGSSQTTELRFPDTHHDAQMTYNKNNNSTS